MQSLYTGYLLLYPMIIQKLCRLNDYVGLLTLANNQYSSSGRVNIKLGGGVPSFDLLTYQVLCLLVLQY